MEQKSQCGPVVSVEKQDDDCLVGMWPSLLYSILLFIDIETWHTQTYRIWPLKPHAPKHIPASTCNERKRKHAKETEKERICHRGRLSYGTASNISKPWTCTHIHTLSTMSFSDQHRKTASGYTHKWTDIHTMGWVEGKREDDKEREKWMDNIR